MKIFEYSELLYCFQIRMKYDPTPLSLLECFVTGNVFSVQAYHTQREQQILRAAEEKLVPSGGCARSRGCTAGAILYKRFLLSH